MIQPLCLPLRGQRQIGLSLPGQTCVELASRFTIAYALAPFAWPVKQADPLGQDKSRQITTNPDILKRSFSQGAIQNEPGRA